MEKIKKILLLIIVCTLSTVSLSQDIIKKGLIRTPLTISPSSMLSSKQSNFYLHGTLEGYITSDLSIAGEGYLYMGGLSSENIFETNHNVFFGVNKHLILNNNDLYIGFQPGLAFTSLNPDNFPITNSRLGINPVVSIPIGYNYYVNKVFHFFVQSRVILGTHLHDYHQSLSEFRFSAGLGINFNLIKDQ